jgi:hypothetical protein
LSHDWQNLHRTIAGLNADSVGRAVNILVRARRVYVVAGFSTFPVAHYFALILDRLRSDISLLASNDAFATPRLVEMKPEDCVLAFTFPRYASATHRIVMWAKDNKAKVHCRHRLADLGGRTGCPRGPARRLGGNRDAEFAGGADGGCERAAQWRGRRQGDNRAGALQPPRPADEPLGRVPAQAQWDRLKGCPTTSR